MTKYVRNLPVKIETVAVLRKTPACVKSELLVDGWKVYVNGAKFPEKPRDYYAEDEEVAISLALIDYKTKYGV